MSVLVCIGGFNPSREPCFYRIVLSAIYFNQNSNFCASEDARMYNMHLWCKEAELLTYTNA